ncbi:MAG: YfhO family protein [candidate division WOR-3 bacterium]|nr:YfhO family protein [candidate division WOR-3 bacterium]
MKKDKMVKLISEKPFHLSNKLAVIILILLPITYFLIFAPGLITGSKMMYGSDWLLGGYASRMITAQQLAQYKTPAMWYNYIFGGLPSYGDNNSLYTIIRLIIPTHIFWTYLFICGLIVAGLGMFLFLKSLDLSNYTALIGAIAYSFAGNLVSTTYAGHEGRLLSMAFFPLAFFLWNKALTTHKFFWFILAGVLAGFSMTHAHFQLTYYGLWFAFAYFIVQLIWQRQQNKIKGTLKLIGYAIITVIIALGTLAMYYMPLLANLAFGARGEIRGYEFASSWALPPKELFDLIVPQFSGILDNYWGENFFKLHTEYFGIIFLLMAIITLFIKFKERKVLFFFIAGIISALTALGGHTPFFKLVYYLLPGVKRFRGPSMVFYLAAFSAIVLGSIGLQYLFDYNLKKKVLDPQTKKKIIRFVYTTVIVFIVLLLIFVASKNSIVGSIKDNNKLQAFNNNQSVFWSGVLITAILIILAFFLIYQLINHKIKIRTVLLILISLILFDLWRIDKLFLKQVEHPSVYYAPDEVVKFLKSDTSLYRVHPLYYERSNDGILDLHNIQNAGGYCPNPLQTYQDFIGAERTVMYNAPNLAFTNFLNLLNIKYIVSIPLPNNIAQFDAQTQARITEMRNFVNRPGVEPVYTGRRYVIYQNHNAFSRAFLVPKYEVIKEKDQIINRLKDPNFNPLQYVIISESLPFVPSTSESLVGTIKIIAYTPNRIILQAELDNPGFLVFSENYHPDWQCKVDGKHTQVYRAYHTLRAIYLESGNHHIEFYYYSKLYKRGQLITFITLLFSVIALILTYKYKRPISQKPGSENKP